MKKFAFALAMMPSLVFAAGSNTINFKGQVADQTCQVQVDGDATPLILLPTVSSGALAATGQTAGETPFTVSVSGCTAATADAGQAIKTKFGVTAASSSGNIRNAGTAGNVSLQLVSNGTPVTLVGGAPTAVAGLTLPKGATQASQTFAVRYYADGAATAGTVLGSVQYALEYQ